MIFNINFKSVAAIALLISLTSFAKEDDGLPPEFGEFSLTNIPSAFADGIPELKNAFIDSTPIARNDGTPVGELGVDGGKKEMIIKLAQEIAGNKHGAYDSMLITHKNKLIFESYYSRGRVDLPHPQASTTKSYTALAVGRAIQLGYLTMADLDKPLVSFLNELDTEKIVAGAKTITLHQAMNMRSGIRIGDKQVREIRNDPSRQSGLGQVQALLEQSQAISKKTQVYNYQSSDARITMQVLDAVVPGSANDFIKDELFAKMGISRYSWKNDVNGLPRGYNGSSVTSRDMLKFGALVINKGKWNGEQLISTEFLARATSKITWPTEDWIPDTHSYGYFWYEVDMTVGGKRYDAKLAWGGGGQYIIALEELDLVIVITGHDREDTIMTQVTKQILPAFVR